MDNSVAVEHAMDVSHADGAVAPAAEHHAGDSEVDPNKADSGSHEVTEQQINNRTLVVAKLPLSVTEPELLTIFKPFGIVSCQIQPGGKTHAFLTFGTPEQTQKALEKHRFLKIGDVEVTVTLKTDGTPIPAANLYIQNLDTSANREDVYDLFIKHGEIISVAVMKRPGQHSIAFVQYQSEASANEAISKINGTTFKDSVLSVVVVKPKEKPSDPKFLTIYVKNIPRNLSDEQIKTILLSYGHINGFSFNVGEFGTFCIASFFKEEDARNCIDKLNAKYIRFDGAIVDKSNTQIYQNALWSINDPQEQGKLASTTAVKVCFFESKSERASKTSQHKSDRTVNSNVVTIRNLPPDYNRSRVSHILLKYGSYNILNVTLLEHETIANVAFPNAAIATQVIHEMNNCNIEGNQISAVMNTSSAGDRDYSHSHYKGHKYSGHKGDIRDNFSQNMPNMQPMPAFPGMQAMGNPMHMPAFHAQMPRNYNMRGGHMPNMGPMHGRGQMMQAFPQQNYAQQVPFGMHPNHPSQHLPEQRNPAPGDIQHSVKDAGKRSDMFRDYPEHLTNEECSQLRTRIGTHILRYVQSKYAHMDAHRITGMVLELPMDHLQASLHNTNDLDAYIHTAYNELTKDPNYEDIAH